MKLSKFTKIFIACSAVLFLGWTAVTVSVGSSLTTVCQETVAGYKTVNIKLHNTGTVNALSDCKVETWVGPLSTDWVGLTTWTACQTLATSTMAVYNIPDNAYEKIRVRAQTATSTTPVYCRMYGVK